jgi:hypothetical protein
MKRFDLVTLAAFLLATPGTVAAEGAAEALADWQWYQEVKLTSPRRGEVLRLHPPAAGLRQDPRDLHDLRLPTPTAVR